MYRQSRLAHLVCLRQVYRDEKNVEVKMDKIKKYQRIALLVLMLLAVILLLPALSKLTVDDILTYTPGNIFLAMAVLVCLYSLKALLCAIPMTVLYISAGIMFPPGPAIAVTYAGLICEITIGYAIGRYMGSERIMAMADKNEKAAKFMRYYNRRSNIVVFIVRLLPGPLPFDIMSWLFGASKIGFGPYMFYSLLGVSPAMLPWVLAGNRITNPLSKEFLFPFLVCAAVAAALLLLLRFLEKKRSPQE